MSTMWKYKQGNLQVTSNQQKAAVIKEQSTQGTSELKYV